MTYLIVGFCVAYGAFLIGRMHEHGKISDKLTELGREIRHEIWAQDMRGMDSAKQNGKIELYEHIRNNIV